MRRLVLLLLAAIALVALASSARADEGNSNDDAQCATLLESCLVTCASDIFSPEDAATCRQGCASGNDGCKQGHKIAGRFARMRSAAAAAAAAEA